MNKISTIIFDLGGVIFNNDWHDKNQTKFHEYEKVFGVSYDDMEKGWNKAWPDYQLGKITEDQFWFIFLKTAGSNNIDISLAKKMWRKYVVENENMIDVLQLLKGNYTLAALTTISREWLDFKVAHFNLGNYFKSIVSSGYSGLAKPDVKIYELVLKNLAVSSKECIFIDDSIETLPPAEQLGIKTILFKSRDNLETELKKLNII